MRYQVLRKNKVVLIAKSLSEVSRFMRKTAMPGVKGFSLDTLKKNLNRTTPEGTRFKKFGYEIVKGYDDSQNDAIEKEVIKTIAKAPVEIMAPRNYKLNTMFTKRVDLIDNPIMVRGKFIEDIVKKAMDTIKLDSSYFQMKNSVYRIFINVDYGDIEDVMLSTPYANYNVVLEKLQDILTEALGNYSDDMYINYMEIERINTPPKDEAIVFGSMLDIDAYQKITEGMIFSPDSKKMLCDLSRKYILVQPKTKSRCILTACIMSLKESDDVSHKDIKNFVTRKIPEGTKKNLKEMCPIISKEIKRRINVYFLDYEIEKKVYNQSEKNEINLVIYQGHAIACIPKVNNDDLVTRINNGVANEQTLYESQDMKIKDGFDIATFDLETCDSDRDKKMKHDTIVYACGYYNGSVYKEFFKNKHDNVLKSFVDYLSNKIKRDTIIYAHNGGKFDTYLLLKEILRNSYIVILNLLVNGGRILQLSLIINKKQVLIRDSYNLISSSLDAACNNFKPKTVKLEGDVDHNKINIDNCATNEIYDYVKNYLKNDCISLYEILDIFDKILSKAYKFGIKENITNASIARNFFMTKHYDQEKYPIHKLPDRVDEELRKFYYGGRNECMTKLGHIMKNLYYFDFTSLYPYIMQKYKFQYGEVEELEVKTKKFNPDWFGFVKCRFRHKKQNRIPLHAVVIDGKLCFPYAEKWVESIITTEEIRYSLKKRLGYQYEYIKVYNYKKNARYFKKSVDELYKMKLDAQKDNNKALRSIAKIIINSLYGFFGIRYKDREQTKIIKEKNTKSKNSYKTAEDNRENRLTGYLFSQKLKDYQQIGKYDVYKVVDSIKANFANVGIASMVTSYARLELYKLLTDIKGVGGNIYYMDTDSVVTDYNIYGDERLSKKWVGSGGEALGELTNETGEEGGYYKELVTLGNKMYALKNESLKNNKVVLKMKGLNIKMRFDKKIIDHKNKTIKYTEPNRFEGKYKIDFKDFKLMSRGYDLIGDTLQFRSGVNDMIFKDKGLIKVESCKRIKGPTQIVDVINEEGEKVKVTKSTYTKAVHNINNNKITALIIKE